MRQANPDTPADDDDARRKGYRPASGSAWREGGEITGVMLLVSDLEPGGAQRQVIELARHMDRARYWPVVCSLSDRVPLVGDASKEPFPLIVVRKRWRFDFSTVWKVARCMKEQRIDLVHAFLFDAEIVGRLAGRLAGVRAVIGSERNADYRRPGLHRIMFRMTHSLCDGVIANSRAGKAFVVSDLGIDPQRVHVVPNGVDVGRFCPGRGDEVRSRFGIGTDELVVGMVASFKPQKNHDMFLRVARRVLERRENVRFLLIGGALQVTGGDARSRRLGPGIHRDSGFYHGRIMRSIEESGLKDRVIVAGEQDDAVPFYRACDVTVLTSRHEGTPNVLLESMACGVPVVATKVSDVARIVPEGRVGYVVGVDDDAAMVEAMERLLGDRELRGRLGGQGREWVEREFSTAALCRNTEWVYSTVLAGKGVVAPE